MVPVKFTIAILMLLVIITLMLWDVLVSPDSKVTEPLISAVSSTNVINSIALAKFTTESCNNTIGARERICRMRQY